MIDNYDVAKEYETKPETLLRRTISLLHDAQKIEDVELRHSKIKSYARDIIKHSGNRWVDRHKAVVALADVLIEEKNWAELERFAHRELAITKRHGDCKSIAHDYGKLGIALTRLGKWEELKEISLEQLDFAKEHEQPAARKKAYTAILTACSQCADWDMHERISTEYKNFRISQGISENMEEQDGVQESVTPSNSVYVAELHSKKLSNGAVIKNAV